MALDQIAFCILKELDSGAKGVDAIALSCCSGAERMATPRLIWLEGLGMVEGFGGGAYSITQLGRQFLELAEKASS